MRTSLLGLAAVALAAAAPAMAQDAPAAPAPAITISGGATLVSDYRFRGISQTDKRFAVQGTFTISHESGFYASVWGSSIDDYIANGGDQEIDLIAGYKKTINGTTIDGGVLYYYYPGSGGVNSDFFEPYISLAHTFGPVTAKVTANYGWKQHALATAYRPFKAREDNLYVAGDLSAAIPNTPISLTGHLAHSFGPSYLTAGSNFAKGYTDWNAGAAYTFKNLTVGVQYVDTNGSFITPKGRNASKAGVVGSVGVAF